MNQQTQYPPTPGKVALQLFVFYVLLIGLLVVMLNSWPTARQYLPMGGHSALNTVEIENIKEFLSPAEDSATQIQSRPELSVEEIKWVLTFSLAHLLGTMIVMLPIAITYKAVSFEHGFRQNFLHTLILLPLCATTIVMLIQDSLALAFGLAALVAAVRFRVALEDARDGIFIFAAICVGLATGIGHLGIAVLMSIFFCFASVIMWATGVGQNPLDQARIARKEAKLSGQSETAKYGGPSQSETAGNGGR